MLVACSLKVSYPGIFQEEQRAAIDRKLEEKGRAEKEELRRERLELFNQRKAKQAQIRRLTFKMERVKEVSIVCS